MMKTSSSRDQGGLVLKQRGRLRSKWSVAGGEAEVQMDVQFQHYSLSGAGQRSLSTSLPHTTEGVKNAEKLPRVGVKHFLVLEATPQLTFWMQNLNFRMILGATEVATGHFYLFYCC